MKLERQQFKGRQIEIKGGKDGPELRIDDVPMRYGRLPDGKYFLDDYAYDWADDLVELARRTSRIANASLWCRRRSHRVDVPAEQPRNR